VAPATAVTAASGLRFIADLHHHRRGVSGDRGKTEVRQETPAATVRLLLAGCGCLRWQFWHRDLSLAGYAA
jgi:hypothetical protein